MNERQKSLTAYFSRICFYCTLSIIASLIVVDDHFLFILSVIPFTVFFLLNELGSDKVKFFALQFLALIAFVLITYFITSSMLSMIVMFVLLAVLFIHSTGTGSRDYQSSVVPAALTYTTIILTVIVIVASNSGVRFDMSDFTQHMRTSTDAIMPVLIFNTALTVASRYISSFYSSLTYHTSSYQWRTQPAETLKRIARRSQIILYTFISVMVLLVAAAAARHYDLDFSFSYEFSRRPRPYSIRTMESAVDPELDPRVPDLMPEFSDYISDGVDMEAPEWEMYEDDFDERIITVALYTILVLVVSAVIFIGLKRYKQRVKVKAFGADSDDDVEESEFIIKKTPKTSRRMLFNPNQTVRMLFKRKVNLHRKHGLPVKTSDTANFIAAKISKTEDINELSGLYHKARYSGESVSGAEVRGVKGKQ
jgi:hypothetical protein